MELFISLIITVFVYLAFPIIYRIVTGGITKKQAKKYSLINVLVVFGVIFIIYSALELNAIPQFPVAITYYFIGKRILRNKKIDNEEDEEIEDNISNTQNENITETDN